MNTHLHDAPAQVLQRANEDEIFGALPRYLQGLGLPRGIQDEPAHLSLIRLVRQGADTSRPAIAAATLKLLRAATRDIELFDRDVFESLVYFCAELKDKAIYDELATFASTFSPGHALSKKERSTVLGALVDGKPARSEDFWMAIFERDPNGHAGIAASGLLALDAFEKAASLYPTVIKSAMSGSIVTMLVDMKWDKLPEEGRRRLESALGRVIGKCKPEYAETLRSWLEAKGGRAIDPCAPI